MHIIIYPSVDPSNGTSLRKWSLESSWTVHKCGNSNFRKREVKPRAFKGWERTCSQSLNLYIYIFCSRRSPAALKESTRKRHDKFQHGFCQRDVVVIRSRPIGGGVAVVSVWRMKRRCSITDWPWWQLGSNQETRPQQITGRRLFDGSCYLVVYHPRDIH
jgi:hypothetical protein